MKKLSFLFSMSFMGILLIILIVVLALATFIESSYNTETAWAVAYGTRWFEILLLLISINIVGVMINYRFYTRKKMVVFVFHLAFLLILGGAAITRFISYEGIMHIREEAMSNTMLSDNAFVHVVLESGDDRLEAEKEVMITELTPKDFRMSGRLDGQKVKVKSTGFMSNAMEQWVAGPGGVPFLQMVMVTDQQTSAGLPSGTSTSVLGIPVSFNHPDTTVMLRFSSEGSDIFVTGAMPITSMQMGAGGGMEYPAGEKVIVEEGKLYAMGELRMALQNYIPSATRKLVQAPQGQMGGLSAVRFEIDYRGMTSELFVPGMSRLKGQPVSGKMGDLDYTIVYGAREIGLPFSLFLKDFQVERYPGSNSPSSFASEVVLVDKEMGIQEDRRIFMNNVLKHRGYRFYQSSYDNDEKGTILSVNRDRAGTFVTYMGYVVLIAGMILAMFMRGTRFARIAKNTTTKAAVSLLALLLFGSSMQAFGQEVPPKDVAREFGYLWVQDKGGRFKPMNTLSSEVVHKITKKGKYEGYTHDQVMLGLMMYPDVWQEKDLFKVKHPELHRILGYKGEMVSFNDLMDTTGSRYLLSELVNAAYSKQVVEQGDLDKEVMKLDDRVNALFLVQSGGMLNIFPDEDAENHKWHSVSDALGGHLHQEADTMSMVFLRYLNSLTQGDYDAARAELQMLMDHQDAVSGSILPGERKKKLEIAYNKVNIFPRLGRFYGLFGVLMMVFQFLIVFRPKKLYRWLFNVGVIHLAVAWIIHTVVLGIRWYISGHAPMSNGYESMIFVAWVTILAGLIFVRRSGYVMGLTAILAFLALMVAGMSNMNPEITNLVPVLKSPWLTIHVTVIMAGYGFLGLASILGLLNLTLYAALTEKNSKRVSEVINNVSNVNHLTLIVGLYFMTAGMFLGGVWANESWGRYWGWDPKETWALITVLVYAFVTHMHRIPGMRGRFAFNLASFISYSSVMMTYFGVNYFLGGIHSYASGSAFKIPAGVYISIAVVIVLCIFAYRRQQKYLPDTPEED